MGYRNFDETSGIRLQEKKETDSMMAVDGNHLRQEPIFLVKASDFPVGLSFSNGMMILDTKAQFCVFCET